jgi:hypothetical protein
MRDEQLLGLSLDDADTLARENGFTIRPWVVDGQPQIGTCDVQMKRINVELKNGIVVKIKGRG